MHTQDSDESDEEVQGRRQRVLRPAPKKQTFADRYPDFETGGTNEYYRPENLHHNSYDFLMQLLLGNITLCDQELLCLASGLCDDSSLELSLLEMYTALQRIQPANAIGAQIGSDA